MLGRGGEGALGDKGMQFGSCEPCGRCWKAAQESQEEEMAAVGQGLTETQTEFTGARTQKLSGWCWVLRRKARQPRMVPDPRLSLCLTVMLLSPLLISSPSCVAS